MFQTKKPRAGKNSKIHKITLNFLSLDFLVWKIKKWEIQNTFCHSLPYFSIYTGKPKRSVESEEKMSKTLILAIEEKVQPLKNTLFIVLFLHF